jgi:hypothetical protein
MPAGRKDLAWLVRWRSDREVGSAKALGAALPLTPDPSPARGEGRKIWRGACGRESLGKGSKNSRGASGEKRARR